MTPLKFPLKFPENQPISPKMGKKALDLSKIPICKELSCFEHARIKGFCRLHFLKVLVGKEQGDSKPRGQLEVAKDPSDDDEDSQD